MSLRKAVHGWIVAATGLAADRVRWANRGQAVQRPSTPGAWVSLRELAEEGGAGPDWTEVARNTLVFADLAVASVDAGANTLTVTAHGRATGDGPVQLETTGTAPGGLAVATDYWPIAVDANTLQLAATFVDAIDLIAIDLTSAGTGTHALVATDDTLAAGAELTSTTKGQRTATVSIQCYDGEPIAGQALSPMERLDRVRAAAALDGIRAAMRAEGAAIESIGNSRDLSVALNGGATFEPRAAVDARIHLAAPALTETMTIIATASATGTVT